jgi:hypothetical protein
VIPYTGGFSHPSLSNCSDCYRLERQLPGGVRTHWKTVPWHGAPQDSIVKRFEQPMLDFLTHEEMLAVLGQPGES